MRFSPPVFLGATAGAAGVIAAAAAAASVCSWNLTASLPRGLYHLDAAASPSLGSAVIFSPPPAAARLLAERHYLPPDARLLKLVVALPGDHVCVGRDYVARGLNYGVVLDADSDGRPLTPWNFCGTVPAGQAFVATSAARSLDSRYFGPVALSSLTVARPLWTY